MSAHAELSHVDGNVRCVVTTRTERGAVTLSPIEAMGLAAALYDYANKVLMIPASARYESLMKRLEAIR